MGKFGKEMLYFPGCGW